MKLLGPNGQPLETSRPKSDGRQAVRARYDASITDEDNFKHWAWADYYSGKAANSIQVRRILRNRARYERGNNSYCAGMVLSLADFCVGTGPRLQVVTDDSALNERVSKEFAAWAKAIRLGEKFHTMRQSRTVDGEAFAMMITNPVLETPAQLDLKLYECDQVSTPYVYPMDPLTTDGLRYDTHDNVIEYHLLRMHPGDLIQWGFPYEYDIVPARFMLHWYRSDRPHQYRGVPDVTPALPLYAQLRRYTLAVLAAAETAADFAGVLQSDLPPDDGLDDGTPFETIALVKRMMTTLPAGWKLGQVKAEQPTTTYDMFKREILNEIARCLNIPYNIAAGNSSSYNYASGRLDHQSFFKSIGVDQSRAEALLDRVFIAWLAEMRLATDLIPRAMTALPYCWYWDGHGHVDPVKEATAQQIRLASCTTTLAAECAREGRNWEEVQDQRAREVQRARRLGLPEVDPPGSAFPPYAPPQAPSEED